MCQEVKRNGHYSDLGIDCYYRCVFGVGSISDARLVLQMRRIEMESKYIGEIVDGKWQVVDYLQKNNHLWYIVENVFNHNRDELSDNQIREIIAGKNSVSRIQHHRITNDKSWLHNAIENDRRNRK